MSAARILVALATYNERENLPGLLEDILCRLPAADALVVDDGSPDGTGQWCDQQALVEPRLVCIHRPSKQGLGTAAVAAIQYAIEHNYDILITLDADWSHDPIHLPELLRATQDADVAIGSRYCNGGGVEGWPIYRRIMSRGLNKLSHLLLRLPVRDASGSYRAYRVAKLKKIDLARIHSSGYSYLEEILWHLHHAGASFAEIPITFHQRRAGRSKISLREFISKIRTLVRLARQK